MSSMLRAAPTRCALPALLCVLVALLASPARAGADVFGPISLVSEGMLGGESQQAEYAHDPAISGDGRYVAFDGSIAGVTGVWRRDIETGEIQQVAGGDAELPSISEDGRYISFTTNEGASLAAITDGRIEEHPQPEAVNVYVRDMELPVPASGSCESPPAQCPFTVVSAPSGSVEPLTYAEASTSTGSTAIGRSAISADGQEVAFVTTAISDLTDPQTPGEPKTPAFQVAVRYLANDTTRLVSGRYEPATGRTTEAPVSGQEGSTQYGAVYPGIGVGFAPPPAYGQYGANPPPGASLSADGTTVAWMGADIGEQAPLLAEETRQPHYTEPLWRRIAAPETPTERVTGGSDPLSPECVASGETALHGGLSSPSDPCQGPFATPEGVHPGILAGGSGSSFVPRLSADGYTVAFVAQAPLVSLGTNFGRSASDGQPGDLYVADMHPGRTRDQALTQLTELAGGAAAGLADTASIVDFGISPLGDQVAFTTRRTQFPLGLPAYVSAPASEAGMDELFDADLRDGTLTRVTQGYEGGPGAHPHTPKPAGQDPYENEGDGALSPSFSASGEILAFSSTASNLVWDDGNTPVEIGGPLDGADAFVVERRAFGSLPSASYISPAPAGPPLAPARGLSVTALSRRDGSVLLYIEVPGTGALRAVAHSAVPIRLADRSRGARGARDTPHARGRGRRASYTASRSGRAHETVVDRAVAAVTAPTQPGELVRIVLKPAKPYAALVSQPGGLSATVNLIFVPSAGRPILRQSVAVLFLSSAHNSRRSGRGARAGRRR